MTISPDLALYDVSLKLYDRDPQQVLTAALLDLTTKISEWVPAEGHTEVLLLESMALEVAELIFAINRVPNAIVEALMRLYGVTRSSGTPPVTTLTFTASDTTGHTIPSGTRAVLSLGEFVAPIVFSTDVDVVIPAASTNSPGVAATGDRNTSIANGVSSGATLTLLDAIAYVDYVHTGTVVGSGQDAENDDAFRRRAVARFARITETLVLPSQFQQAALESGLAFRAFALDDYNPGVGTAAGHITIAVYGEGDTAVSGPNKTALDTDFQARAAANLAVHVVDPTLTTQAVTVTVKGNSTFSSAEVQANVTAAVQAFLNPDTWQWDGVVRRNDLIRIIGNASGVVYVSTLTTPAADVTLAGYANLARAGAVTVTVT